MLRFRHFMWSPQRAVQLYKVAFEDGVDSFFGFFYFFAILLTLIVSLWIPRGRGAIGNTILCQMLSINRKYSGPNLDMKLTSKRQNMTDWRTGRLTHKVTQLITRHKELAVAAQKKEILTILKWKRGTNRADQSRRFPRHWNTCQHKSCFSSTSTSEMSLFLPKIIADIFILFSRLSAFRGSKAIRPCPGR